MDGNIFELSQQLGEMLKAKGWKVSCAESCTGGGLAYAITSVAGSSNWFERSFVTYSNAAKSELLQVGKRTLDQFGAVSQQTVLAMARGCAVKTAADLTIAVSGIAGPDGGSDEKPVGLVWFGFYVNGDLSAQQHIFSGDRQSVRNQAVETALQHAISLIGKKK